MIPVVPFLCKKVRLRWRGVTATKASQPHEGLGYSSTMGIPWGRNQGLYKLLGARIHNLIGGSQDELPELLHKNKLQEDLT